MKRQFIQASFPIQKLPFPETFTKKLKKKKIKTVGTLLTRKWNQANGFTQDNIAKIMNFFDDFLLKVPPLYIPRDVSADLTKFFPNNNLVIDFDGFVRKIEYFDSNSACQEQLLLSDLALSNRKILYFTKQGITSVSSFLELNSAGYFNDAHPNLIKAILEAIELEKSPALHAQRVIRKTPIDDSLLQKAKDFFHNNTEIKDLEWFNFWIKQLAYWNSPISSSDSLIAEISNFIEQNQLPNTYMDLLGETPTLQEWLDFPSNNTKYRECLILRLSGLTLAECGTRMGHTRERARQICKSELEERPNTLYEDCYAPITQKYNINVEEFCTITGEKPQVYYYLISAFTRQKPLISDLKLALNDQDIGTALQKKIAAFL